MWQTIIEFVVSPIIGAFMAYVVWKLQQQTKQTNENFVETYEAYKALGGNGMALKMFDEMKSVGINRKE